MIKIIENNKKGMVRLLTENRSEFIKNALMDYIMSHYCHNFKNGKDIEKKIQRLVSEIANTIADVDG